MSTPPVTFTSDAHYGTFGDAHNIAINEDTGFAYAVGANACSRGLHMIDIADPLNPAFAGCFGADGYTHDVQCVVYTGPDVTYQGMEICFASNEDTLTIVDVTDKSRPRQLARQGYARSAYTHQTWLTEDHRHLLMGDELDELQFNLKTRTRIWDVTDLEKPFRASNYVAATLSPDHNQYVVGKHVYQSNYRAGLRILDMGCGARPKLHEIAYFDVYPQSNNRSFSGAWSNYPFFESGKVIVSSIAEGLFVLRPELPCTDDTPPEVAAGADDLHCLWPPDAPTGLLRYRGLRSGRERRLRRGRLGVRELRSAADGLQAPPLESTTRGRLRRQPGSDLRARGAVPLRLEARRSPLRDPHRGNGRLRKPERGDRHREPPRAAQLAGRSSVRGSHRHASLRSQRRSALEAPLKRGAVILSLGYELVMAWLDEDGTGQPEPDETPA